MNLGASAGRIPVKVSVAARARVTAGFANEKVVTEGCFFLQAEVTRMRLGG